MSDNPEIGNPGDLAGAYALNALTAEEAAAYEAHLAASEQARIEAAELSDTAVALGLATAPVQPSAGLKSALMARLASTPQLAPVREAATVTDAPAPVEPATPVLPGAVAEPAASVAEASPDLSRHEPASHEPASHEPAGREPAGREPAAERARRRWFKRPAGLLLAAAAAIALFVGGAFVGQTFTTDQFALSQASGLAEINAEPDVQRAAATTSDGHQATLVWSGKLGRSALLVDGLPALPSDKDYQLWYIGGSGPVAAGTFDSTGTGTAWRVLDGTMKAGDVIGVTVEPRGGSKQPTSEPIVAIQSS